MGKGRGAGERIERLERLFSAGDHGAARSLARLLVAEREATLAERAAAEAVIARLAPDRGVVIAAGAGLLLAVGVAGWVLAR